MIHSASRTDSTEIQQQQRRDAGRGGLGGQAQGVRTGAAGVLHGGMKNRVAQPQVEAEHQPGRADHLDDRGEIGKGLERLQAHHDLTGAAGEHFERAARLVGAGVDQQRAGEPGVELGQLPEQRSLEGPALDRVEIGHVALVDPERRRGTRAATRPRRRCGPAPGPMSVARSGCGRPPGRVRPRHRPGPARE